MADFKDIFTGGYSKGGVRADFIKAPSDDSGDEKEPESKDDEKDKDGESDKKDE